MVKKKKNITKNLIQDNMLQSSVILNNDQIKSLPTTPIQLIPAPGANKIIQVIGGLLYLRMLDSYGNVASFESTIDFDSNGFPWQQFTQQVFIQPPFNHIITGVVHPFSTILSELENEPLRLV